MKNGSSWSGVLGVGGLGVLVLAFTPGCAGVEGEIDEGEEAVASSSEELSSSAKSYRTGSIFARTSGNTCVTRFSDNWVRMHVCDGSAGNARKWTYDAGRGVFVNRLNGQCMDLPYGIADAYKPYSTYACHGGDASQRVHMGYGAIKNAAGDKCLDVPYSDLRPGVKLQFWDCNGSNAQRFWIVPGSREIKTVNGLCVDVSGGQNFNGNSIILWSCNGGAAQRFSLASRGLVADIGGKCIRAAGSHAGAAAQLWSCDGSLSQYFWYAGPIKVGNGYMDRRGWSVDHGTVVDGYHSFHGGENQLWEYFP